MNIIINIASYITALTTITATISIVFNKILDNKLKPLANQNRMQFRHEIVTFAKEIKDGDKKTLDEFNSIYELVDEYKNICEQLNIENHLFEESLKIIDKAYEEL